MLKKKSLPFWKLNLLFNISRELISHLIFLETYLILCYRCFYSPREWFP